MRARELLVICDRSEERDQTEQEHNPSRGRQEHEPQQYRLTMSTPGSAPQTRSRDDGCGNAGHNLQPEE
jgi:hypothetical protein